jgi:hypothetical protein
MRRFFFYEEEKSTAQKLYALRLLISRAFPEGCGFYLQRPDGFEKVH